MDDVLVWACQLGPKRGAAAPATGAAAAPEVRAWLGPTRIALDQATVAQRVIQYNSIGLHQLAQFVAYHPAGEPAVLNVLLSQGIGMGDHLPLALLQPRAP